MNFEFWIFQDFACIVKIIEKKESVRLLPETYLTFNAYLELTLLFSTLRTGTRYSMVDLAVVVAEQ